METWVAVASASAVAIIGVLAAAVRLYFQIRDGLRDAQKQQGELLEEQGQLREDVRKGQVEIDQKVADLRLTKRAEHKDLWAVHHDLYQARISAAHEAFGREEDQRRRDDLLERRRAAERAYLNLLDRAVKYPEIFDPSLKGTPEYARFLTGQIEDLLPPELIVSDSLAGSGEGISTDVRDDLRDLVARLDRTSAGVETADESLTRGTAHLIAGNYGAALRNYDQAIEMNPESAEAYNSRGTALFGLDRKDEALEAVERAREIEPESVVYATNVSNVLMRQERFEDALAAVDDAIELDEKPQSHFVRGRSLDSLGRYDDAVRAYERALELDRRDPARFALASSLARAGRKDEAKAAYDSSLKIKAAGSDGHYHRARAHAVFAARDQALLDLRTAVQLDGLRRYSAREERDFEALRDTPEFQEIVATD